MSEELKIDLAAAEAAAPEKVELNEVEQAAYKDGWRPKEEFKGDEAKWVEAAEFMRRKPLFSKIDELKSDAYHTKRELQELKKTLNTLAEHHKKVKEVEYERALRDLQSQKKEAIEDRDGAAVVAIDEQINELRDERRELKSTVQENTAPQPTAEYVAWVKDNGWYLSDQEMHDFADGIGAAYFRRNPHLTPNDIYEHVNKKVRQAFPEKFENPNRQRAAAVDGGSPEARPTRKSSSKQLSREEEDVVSAFVSKGLMTREQYIKELEAMDKR